MGMELTANTETQARKRRCLIICEITEGGIGGVESVVNQVQKRLEQKNCDVVMMTMKDVDTFKVPFMPQTSSPYPWGIKAKVAQKICDCRPDYIFIVLHGFLSMQAGAYCSKNNIPFTAFYPGRGPECTKAMTGIPCWVTRYFTNGFLSKASRILVPSFSMQDELRAEGFAQTVGWPHGVEPDRFRIPTVEGKADAIKACNLQNLPRPFYLYVGRISKEKNMEAFFNVKVPGTKVVVGPEDCGFKLDALKKRYPEIIFTGSKRGQDLINYYWAADIFLFPSKNDSFGLVMAEAEASGLPVVGFNDNGPRDVVPLGCGVSYLANNDEEFSTCAMLAWADLQEGKVTPEQCHAYAQRFSWDVAMDTLLENFVQVDPALLSTLELQESSCCGCC